MTFRHPLRNEWDQHRAAFAAMAPQGNADGAMARCMLALVPPFLDVLEVERDNRTDPAAMFQAVAAVSGLLIENVIETQNAQMPPRAALERMLTTIHRVVAPKVTRARRSPLILPGDV
ncbi:MULTISPECIES: hypothetical protein [Rhodopseudomonas]|uniref:Uncharacterized protein n=1 Tax=Rhodopseudomonas palustris TaxID=1076 RepID=A0A0D7EE81_RHOPL|nr:MULTISPECIES: hypothetical protein [Rhodopseudomonas]KIZ39053.1 hypothetical protein OO17_21585 [Rhodopseudomonas palustris]MDF3809280.1 hypothetical protein [Rhodopseudomonas sp. BAL398]WOK19036.1 hypothetical protein RBJ75_05825 [Rhodopseudomonas sp. BAL398]